MSRPKPKGPHRRYRVNGKKLAGTLLLMAALAAVLIAAALWMVETAFFDQTMHPASTVVAGTVQQSVVVSPVNAAQTPDNPSTGNGYCIVVDAGHGDFDPGAIGASGVHESELNLAVAQYLKAALEAQGVEVVMTRESDVGLGTTQTESLHERGRIILESGADMVISVHMNSFPQDPGVSGPLVLFAAGSQEGKALAGTMQSSLNDALDADGKARSQDLYVLQQGAQPSVLVECGYLSNVDEERSLQEPAYQQRIAQAICDGAMAYFSRKG